MITYPTIFGIDVSKDQLDLFESSTTKQCFDRISNQASTILKWIDGLDKVNTLCVLEPTSTYSRLLLHHLTQQGIAVKLINPRQSNHFMQALGIINKGDKQAAKTLALMGKVLDLPLYQMPSEMMQKRQQLLKTVNALKKQARMLRNQLHALSYQPIIVPTVKEAFEQTLQTVEQQIQSLEQTLDSLTDEDYEQLQNKILSVKGVGPKTAQALILATGGLDSFTHHRQLAKFVGIVPATHKSGSSVRFKGRITKKGNSELRATLYMAARSAKRFNLACKQLYERLREAGKGHKQAMVAVMNKLLRQIFAVVKKNVTFDNQYFKKFQQA